MGITHLVEGNDEGGAALLEQVDGLDGLLLQAVHDVHHQDGDVAQAGAAGPQVRERLVPLRERAHTSAIASQQQPRQATCAMHARAGAHQCGARLDLELELLAVLPHGRSALADVVARHVGGANLLRDASRLTVLHVRSPHVVQNLGLPCSRLSQGFVSLPKLLA